MNVIVEEYSSSLVLTLDRINELKNEMESGISNSEIYQATAAVGTWLDTVVLDW